MKAIDADTHVVLARNDVAPTVLAGIADANGRVLYALN